MKVSKVLKFKNAPSCGWFKYYTCKQIKVSMRHLVNNFSTKLSKNVPSCGWFKYYTDKQMKVSKRHLVVNFSTKL